MTIRKNVFPQNTKMCTVIRLILEENALSILGKKKPYRHVGDSLFPEKYRPTSDVMVTLPPIRSMSPDSIASFESLKESLSPGIPHRKEIRMPSESKEHARQGENQLPDTRSNSINRSSHMTTAHVHPTPNSYRKLNGVAPRRNAPVTRQNSFPSRKSSGYTRPGRGRRTASFNSKLRARSLDSIASSELRTAYDFARHPNSNKKTRQRQVALEDLEFAEQEEADVSEYEDSPWMPTGVYAAFVVTSWSAILKLIDGIEGNGPAVCSSSEEVRLWICAGSLTVIHGLAEAIFKRKELFKVLFSMVCVLGYMVITHTQPLSCRLGVVNVTETSKWQSAICFFVTALLAAVVYHDIKTDHLRRTKVKSPMPRRKRRRRQDDNRDYDSDELNNFELPSPPQPQLVPFTV